MTARAYVRFRPELQRYELPIVNVGGQATTAVGFARGVTRVAEGEVGYPDDIEWLSLTEAETRALYDALRAEFEPRIEQAAADALRTDYTDERDRVDRLIGAVITIATHPGG